MFLEATSSATTASTSKASGTSQAATDSQQLGENLNKFLTLLTTQLKNQDPLQPMDTNQFTQQLVQFASVEQQIYQNSNLEKMLAMQKTTQASNLVNYIGNSVELAGNDLCLQDGIAGATYTLGEDAADVQILIRDATDRLIATLPGEKGAGAHAFSWQGVTASGQPLPDGLYQVDVAATGKDGSALDVEVRTLANVSGVANDGDEPELMLGESRVPLSNILAVRQAKSTAEVAGN